MEFFNISYLQGVATSITATALIAISISLSTKTKTRFRARKIKKIQSQIELLSWEKKHLTDIKKSSTAMSRHAFSDIFTILLLISFSLGSATVGRFFLNFGPIFEELLKATQFISVAAWIISLMIALDNIKKFRNLNKYQEAIEKINNKSKTLEEKIASLTSTTPS